MWSCQSFFDGLDHTKLAANPAECDEATRLLRELEDPSSKGLVFAIVLSDLLSEILRMSWQLYRKYNTAV